MKKWFVETSSVAIASSPFVMVVVEKRAENASDARETLPKSVLRSEALPPAAPAAMAFVTTTKEAGALVKVASSRSMTLGGRTVDWVQLSRRSRPSKSSQNFGVFARPAQNPEAATSGAASAASRPASAGASGGPAPNGGSASGPESAISTGPPPLDPHPTAADSARTAAAPAAHPRMDRENTRPG